MAQVGARLVVIDPLMAYLDGKVNSWRDQDVRAALAPLARLAGRSGAAILILRHLNKAGGGNALYRSGGSIGIIGAARSGLVIAQDPDDLEHQRILASSKSNLGPPLPALCYRVRVRGADSEATASDTGAPAVEWLGACDYTATALLNAASQETADTRTALEEAVAFLREALRDGPRASREIQREGAALGISGGTLLRARKALGVRCQVGGYQGQWLLSLPADDAAAASPPDSRRESRRHAESLTATRVTHAAAMSDSEPPTSDSERNAPLRTAAHPDEHDAHTEARPS